MNTKVKVILLLMTLSFTVTGFSQNCDATFSGKVVDALDKPLVGVAVVINPGQRGQTTDAEGAFFFSDVCPGIYQLEVKYLGFKTYYETIAIEGDVRKRIYLQIESEQLEEVVVEEAKAGTEHAHNTASLNEKDLAESAGKSIGEALKEVTGVSALQTGPGIFKPVIHGVHSQRVLILNYGIRQEGQQWGAEHAPEIDPFVASNIVVIKDASSIKYGTDAIGGVVVVNPPELPVKAGINGTVNTVFQSNNRSGTLSATVEGGLKNRPGWGWRLQGTGKKGGDFHTPDYNLTNTGVEELNFSTAAGYHDLKRGIEVFFSHFRTEIGILKGTAISTPEDLFAAMERVPPLYTENFSYKINEPRQEVSHNLLKLNGHINLNKGDLRVQYGFQNNNRKEFDLRKGSYNGIPSIDLKLNTHTVEAEWESTYSNTNSICVGVTGMYQVNDNIFGTRRLPFIPDFNNLSGGVFAISKLHWQKVTMDVGARYDYRSYNVKGFDSNNKFYSGNLIFHNPSATAGLTLDLERQRILNLNISSSWRPPHVAELYSLGTHQSAAAIEYGLFLDDSGQVMDIDEVKFNPEQAVKFVSTYKHTVKNVSFEVSPYANYIFNYIYLKPSGITQNVRGLYPYFRYTQTNALFVGVDASAVWRVTDQFSLTPKVSLLRASDESNNDYLMFIPANRAELGLRYEKDVTDKFKRFFAESKVRHVAKQRRSPRVITVRDLQNANEQNTDPFAEDDSNFDFMEAPDAYWLLNLAAGITLQQEKLTYEFRVASENALNTSYRDYTNRFRYYTDDIGRNFIVSLRCIF